MKVNRITENLSNMFFLNSSQKSENKIIALLITAAIIIPIISNGSVYDYIAIFTLVFFFLSPQPNVIASSCH